MAASNADVLSLQLEKVNRALRPLFERDGTTFSLFKDKGEVEKVSSRQMRIPVKLRPPGKFKQTNFDSGDMGIGNGSLYSHALVSPIDFVVALKASKKAAISTDSTEKAIANAVKRDVADGIEEMRWGIDSLLQTPGTGQLSTVESGFAGTTLTLGSNFTTMLLHRGMNVEAYDPTFTTKRAGIEEILTVDYENRQITFDSAFTGLADGDALVVEGLTGANPVSLYGIPYHQSDAASGLWLGIDRSTTPEVRTPSVDAGNNPLNPQFVRRALNRMRQLLGNDSLKSAKVFAHLHLAQEHAYEAIGLTISEIIKTTSAKESLEPFFEVKTMAGCKIVSSIKADPTRIDFLVASNFGRAESLGIGFYTDPGDSATMFGQYGASGGRAAAVLWYMATSLQFYTVNPRQGAYIKNLAVPTGYVIP